MSLANDTDTPVGTITFKKKSPRRRLQHENVWEYLKLQSTIYKGDYILTEDLSEAQLIFKDDNYTVDAQESNVSRVVYNELELEQIKTGTADIYSNSMMKVGDDKLLPIKAVPAKRAAQRIILNFFILSFSFYYFPIFLRLNV